MGWLDINPSGRLLNRMSDDQNKVDSMLPFAVGSVFSTLFAFAGDMLTVTIITRYLIFMMLPIFLIYFWVMSRYLNASREIQRLISITQSPALTYMTECSAGIFVLRSFGEETINRIVNKNVNLIDLNSQMVYIMNACTSWFVFRTEILGLFLISFYKISFNFFSIIIFFRRCNFIMYNNSGILRFFLSYSWNGWFEYFVWS